MRANAIVNGVPWFDDQQRAVNAHGGCIVEENGRFYLFGEYKPDHGNEFIGFSCYSSSDLVDWTFERIVLPQQTSGLLGPGRVGERVKVMRIPSTGDYVMYLHADNATYTDPHICFASCSTIAGDYEFHGPLLTQDNDPLPAWDVGAFQDDDGVGYLLLHEGDIYRLSADYRHLDARVASHVAPGGESPAMFVANGLYYLLLSNKTSWERNDNYYLTAPAISGPWTHRGLFTPPGTLTFDSQCTYVFPLRTTATPVVMYMGDRWSFPCQGSSATYVWLPAIIAEERLQIPRFMAAWSPESLAEIALTGDDRDFSFTCDRPGEAAHIEFTGRQIAILGTTGSDGGYARVEILDNSRPATDPAIVSHLIDFYSKVPSHGLRYVSPQLPAGQYSLKVTVTGSDPLGQKRTANKWAQLVAESQSATSGSSTRRDRRYGGQSPIRAPSLVHRWRSRRSNRSVR